MITAVNPTYSATYPGLPGSSDPLLVIDDDVKLNELLRAALTILHHDVITVNDGLTGLVTAARVNPSKILLDICLPDVDGLTILSKLRLQNPHAQIVVTSCLTPISWSERALAVGADTILRKPYTLDDVRTAFALPQHPATTRKPHVAVAL
jgi:DNA-binding response OmpR family regulator